MPRRSERTGLGFSVTDHHRYQQVGIVESRAEGMRHAVAEFAALMNGTRRLRRAMAADAAGKREVMEEALQARQILAFLWIDLAVRAFQIDGSEDAWRPVTGSCQEDRIHVVPANEAIHVDVDEGKAGA